MPARLTWTRYEFGQYADTRLGRITIRPVTASRGPRVWDIQYPDGRFARRNDAAQAQAAAQQWFDHELAHLP